MEIFVKGERFMKFKVGFIGVGNMGGALLDSVSNVVEHSCITFFDTNNDKVSSLSELKDYVYSDISTLSKESKFIFIGVKPGIVKIVSKQIKDCINKNSIVVSMAAGLSIDTLSSYFDTDRIIRIMPNTPVSVNSGMVLYSVGAGVGSDDLAEFRNIMSSVGVLDYIEEKYIDAAAAVSGCGPAFVYMFADALADGAVKCGLPREKALLYAKQTIMGSGLMMLRSDKHPSQLKDEVCSPGGTTIEGVLALENNKFRYGVSDAVVSAYKKTSELNK